MLQNTRKSKQQKGRKLPLLQNLWFSNRFDWATFTMLVAVVGYMGLFMPGALGAACFAGAIAIAFALFQNSFQLVRQAVPAVKSWHLVTGVLAVTVFCQVMSINPASAQFFNALETAITNVIADSGTGISEDLIGTIFVFFRVIIVLAFVIGVIVAFTQATRGNDWQPIANLLAIGVAFVIGVEVITILILGGGGAG